MIINSRQEGGRSRGLCYRKVQLTLTLTLILGNQEFSLSQTAINPLVGLPKPTACNKRERELNWEQKMKEESREMHTRRKREKDRRDKVRKRY